MPVPRWTHLYITLPPPAAFDLFFIKNRFEIASSNDEAAKMPWYIFKENILRIFLAGVRFSLSVSQLVLVHAADTGGIFIFFHKKK